MCTHRYIHSHASTSKIEHTHTYTTKTRKPISDMENLLNESVAESSPNLKE